MYPSDGRGQWCVGGAEGRERSFLQHLAQRRVGGDGGGEVPEAGTHLERQGERTGELSDAGSDGLQADDGMVVAAATTRTIPSVRPSVAPGRWPAAATWR